jgi:hypothetical protein
MQFDSFIIKKKREKKESKILFDKDFGCYWLEFLVSLFVGW